MASIGKLRLYGVLVSAAFVFLPGCNLAPQHHQPALPTAATYPLESDGGGSVTALGWRQFFSDPSLQVLIEQALGNNRDLRIATQRMEEARAFYGIQRADQFPSIDVTAEGARARLPADLSPSGRAQTAGQYQVALGMSAWELDFWGRVRNLKEAALENYLATDAAQRAVAIALVRQVAETYLVAGELDERIRLAERTIATREESYRIARRRYEVGAASRIDAVQAETLFTQARADWAALERQRDQNRNALIALVGLPVVADIQPLALNEANFRHDLRAGLPSELLLNRPDIVAAEHRLKGANANIGAARAAFFPRILLTGAYGSASSELDGLFTAGSHSWSFVPSLTLPLFDAGRNAAGLDLARARSNIAVADYERTVQIAFREVADALAGRHWLAQQLTFLQASLAAQTERARLAQLRYRSGAAPYLEVLDAERDLFAVEQLLVQTRRQLLAGSVSLYAALGGGGAATLN